MESLQEMYVRVNDFLTANVLLFALSFTFLAASASVVPAHTDETTSANESTVAIIFLNM